jgi:hypothetical protein
MAKKLTNKEIEAMIERKHPLVSLFTSAVATITQVCLIGAITLGSIGLFILSFRFLTGLF